MSAALEIVGLILALGGWILIGATLSNNYWKVSTLQGSVITTSNLYDNLWKSCAEDSTGVTNCRQFDSMLGLPAFLQACRALMISSLILGLFATVLGLLGLKCTKIGSSNKIMKGKIALTGGVLFIIGGLSSMIAVSWYAQQITSEFFNPMYGGTKFEFGDALYLGWAGSALCMLGGSFLCCSCKRDEVPKRR
ncbi:claudin-15 [Latimeria chalumnae]|uniref:claudin-15 n=1 Tax=Latimeria chalumnae TaxID=7897 RepID=UPI00313B4F0F